jgi:PmbA protein
MSATTMKDRTKELIEVAGRACELAKRAGADAAEVLVQAGAELSVKVRKGETELVHEAASKALGLRVFRDHRAALTYTSDLSPAALERFVADTVELARLSEPDELNELPDPKDLAREIPELDLFDPATPGVDAGEALERCRRGETAALEYSEKVTNSEGATYSRVTGASALATTDGFSGGYAGSYQSLVVEPICDDADGKKRNGHWWTADRFLDRLEPPEAVGKKAAELTVRKLGAQKIDTGPLPIVFDPEAGRALVRLLFSVISGGAIYRKSSYLMGREGSEVASSLVSIVDDPLIRRGPGSRPYDGEGLPARKNPVVDRGVLKTYLCDTYSARKLGRKSNGCAGRGVGGAPHVTTSNFLVQSGQTPAAEIVKQVKRGLFVTEMMGFGFNAVTGDFSRGAGGFLIENGELTQPVTEVTISANLDEILKGIDAVGDDLDMRSSTACPTFRVRQMMVAGK